MGLPAEIKGFGGSLSLVLNADHSFDEILIEVQKLLKNDTSLNFLGDADILLRFGERQFSQHESDSLQTIFKDRGLSLYYSEENEKATSSLKKNSIKKSQLNTQHEENSSSENQLENEVISEIEMVQQKDHSIRQEQQLTDGDSSDHSGTITEMSPGIKSEEPLVIRQTLRSGQSIRTSKSVIVFGDLNSGAEIISDGDIVVLGNIRGMVHAGASGNEKAIIIGLRVIPTQIRIAAEISQPPEENFHDGQLGPEKVFVENGMIVIDNLACTTYELMKSLSNSQGSENKKRQGSGGMLVSVGTIRW